MSNSTFQRSPGAQLPRSSISMGKEWNALIIINGGVEKKNEEEEMILFFGALLASSFDSKAPAWVKAQ